MWRPAVWTVDVRGTLAWLSHQCQRRTLSGGRDARHLRHHPQLRTNAPHSTWESANERPSSVRIRQWVAGSSPMVSCNARVHPSTGGAESCSPQATSTTASERVTASLVPSATSLAETHTQTEKQTRNRALVRVTKKLLQVMIRRHSYVRPGFYPA